MRFLRTKGETSELTLSLSIQYDTLEVCYGCSDSKDMVPILDMTLNKKRIELLSG